MPPLAGSEVFFYQLGSTYLYHSDNAEQPHSHVGLVDIISVDDALNLTQQGYETEIVAGEDMDDLGEHGIAGEYLVGGEVPNGRAAYTLVAEVVLGDETHHLTIDPHG